MEIRTGASKPLVSKRARVAEDATPSLYTPPTTPSEDKVVPWRRITLNEAVVEIPQGLLDLSGVRDHAPIAGGVAQAAVSSLAAYRAAECFYDAHSLEEYLEGASSAALAASGFATFLPGSVAGVAGKSALFAHGAFEFGLGVREITEELRKDKPAKLELAAGVLDTVKGASTFVPLAIPELETPVAVFQIGAVLAKTVLETHLDR